MPPQWLLLSFWLDALELWKERKEKKTTDYNTGKKTGRIKEMKDWNQTYFTLKPPAEYLNNPVETVKKKKKGVFFVFFALFWVSVCVRLLLTLTSQACSNPPLSCLEGMQCEPDTMEQKTR